MRGSETTHYSVVDKAGNAVAVTYTINNYFGAKVIAGDTGFFLNDEMDDFTAKPGVANMFGLVQGEANAIEPGKRPLCSMSPTIVTKDGKLFLVLGSPGGSRIITTVVETIVNVVDYGMDSQAARRRAAHPSSMAARHDLCRALCARAGRRPCLVAARPPHRIAKALGLGRSHHVGRGQSEPDNASLLWRRHSQDLAARARQPLWRQ